MNLSNNEIHGIQVNYFTLKREKMDSSVVIVIYDCIAKSMIKRSNF